MTTTVITQRHRKPRRDISPNSMIGRLNLEWEALRQDGQANAAAAAWAVADPALTGLTSLDLIHDAVAGRRVDERIDAIFCALVRRAAGRGPGAGLAARILTQLMLPKAILIARTCARELHDGEEQVQLAVCALYEVIRTFPVQARGHHVPASIAWDTVHAVRRSVLAQTAEIPADDSNAWPEPPSEPNASEQIARLIGWALRERIISTADARLLIARYSADDPSRATWKTIGNLAHVAAETGITLVTAGKRCSRAVRKITAAVSAYPGPVAASGR